MDNLTTTVIKKINTKTAGESSVRAISRQLDLQKALNVYLDNICCFQELNPGDNGLREKFALTFSHG